MSCLDELTLATAVAGELEGDRHAVDAHLAECVRCRRLADALAIEAALLGDILRAPALVAAPTAPATEAGAGRALAPLGAVVAATGTALTAGAAAVPALPPALHWISPFHLDGQLTLFFGAVVYGALEGGAMVSSVMTTLAVAAAAVSGVSFGWALGQRARRVAGSGLLAASLLLTLAVPAEGLEVRRAERDVTVPAGETVDETLIALGDTIVVEGTVNGDLIAAGRQVRVLGTVRGNVLAFAQQVEVDGEVGGSLLAFAQSVESGGRVAGSAYGWGQRVTVASGAEVAGDVSAFAADARVDGVVRRDLHAYGARVDITGTVERDVSVGGARLVVGAPARIGGRLTADVPAADAVEVAAGATVVGGTDIRVAESEGTRSRYLTGSFYVGLVLRIGAAFLTGWLLFFWVAPRLAETRLDSPVAALRALGIGFVWAVTVPIGAIVVAITLVGLPVALVAIWLWVVTLYLGKIVVAAIVGGVLIGADRRLATTLLLGLVVVYAAVSLPYVGWLANVLATLAGAGTVATQLLDWQRVRTAGA